jgi:hypothetical protein
MVEPVNQVKPQDNSNGIPSYWTGALFFTLSIALAAIAITSGNYWAIGGTASSALISGGCFKLGSDDQNMHTDQVNKDLERREKIRDIIIGAIEYNLSDPSIANQLEPLKITKKEVVEEINSILSKDLTNSIDSTGNGVFLNAVNRVISQAL